MAYFVAGLLEKQEKGELGYHTRSYRETIHDEIQWLKQKNNLIAISRMIRYTNHSHFWYGYPAEVSMMLPVRTANMGGHKCW
jgi:hypothetical protein